MTFEELISALGERIGVDLAAEDGSCVINVDDNGQVPSLPA